MSTELYVLIHHVSSYKPTRRS